ncbi:hypothetical protein ACLHDG_13815 [Sulfurovum sp. CS9]|uniref:hypothetical protein n=1 Tax=Sulfurovum sp. CS9 TaxID=3391146 RepID=UPI0039EB92FC
MNSKDFVANSFTQNPQRYGIDNGDLNMVNDYLSSRGWDTLTREQFRAVASIARLRNMFLVDNPDYDLRKKNEVSLFIQLSIYDFLDDDTITQTRKLTKYFAGDESRLLQSNSRIKDSVRGVDNEHITAAKIMLPLFVSSPQLKKIKINKDKTSTTDTGFDNDLEEKTQTKLSDEEAGE